jgi:citrate synthase
MATGARIIQLLAAATVYPDTNRGGTVAEALQGHWVPNLPVAARAINAALVLCADHELNVSAFTARCVASAGATPYDVVMAGLAALRGSRHGGHTARVEAFLDEVGSAARAGQVLGDRLRRGETIPGFGHPLYPEGDPRGRRLMELATEIGKRSRAVTLAKAVVAEAWRLIGEHPTVDFGLVAISRALGLPAGAPLALFAIGRTAGWIGHALEQYQSGVMIRPRARYTGPAIRNAGPQSA